MSTIKGKTAIIGYGETEFVKPRNNGERSNYSEQCHAARLAIADAGIRKDEIDGLVAISPMDQTASWSQDLAEYLQLRPTFLDSMYFGGGSGNAGILYAAAAIAAGLCHTVLLVGGSVFDPAAPGDHGREYGTPFERDFDTPYGPMADNAAYALIKQRYKHEFGAGEEAFAQISADRKSVV